MSSIQAFSNTALDAEKSKLSWSWASFFNSPLWFFYHGMFFWGLFFASLPLALNNLLRYLFGHPLITEGFHIHFLTSFASFYVGELSVGDFGVILLSCCNAAVVSRWLKDRKIKRSKDKSKRYRIIMGLFLAILSFFLLNLISAIIIAIPKVGLQQTLINLGILFKII